MLLGIDHLVIAVPDPDTAAAELERTVGLAATGGGRHEMWGTCNRLAWLGDTYIELIGLFDPGLAATGAVSRPVAEALAEGRPGLVSYALATDDAGADTARLRAAGSSIGEVETRSRTRPDGEIVTWQAAYGELGPACHRSWSSMSWRAPSGVPRLERHEPAFDIRSGRPFGWPDWSCRFAMSALPRRGTPRRWASGSTRRRPRPTSASSGSGSCRGDPSRMRRSSSSRSEDPAATTRRDVDACGVRWRVGR